MGSRPLEVHLLSPNDSLGSLGSLPRKAPVCDCGQPGVLRVKSDWICDRCRALEQQMAWQSRAEATRPAPASGRTDE